MKLAKRYWCWLILLSAIVLISGCNCQQPEIVSVTPASGPGGTIVEVVFRGGGLGGVVLFDGSSVTTRYASSLGIGHRVRFTVPYNTSTGNYNVQVRSDGKTSPAEVFNVTGQGNVPTPALDGFAISNRDGKEITVFGSNFSTLSLVFIDGTEVNRYAGNSLPFRTLPIEFVDNIIICTPASDLVLGSNHTVQVRNPNGNNSNTLNITIPNRVCQMEFDAIEDIPAPDYYVWRNNTVNTLRRHYTNCGWIIELSYDDMVITDPMSGSNFSNADLYSFWQAYADEPASGYYMHGAFVTRMASSTLLGVMYMNRGRLPSLPADEIRKGYALFYEIFSTSTDGRQKYLRSTIHEAGHGFNLLHSDGDGSMTIMNQTGALGSSWNYTFSNISCVHLESHSLTAVAPGGDPFGSSRGCNSLH